MNHDTLFVPMKRFVSIVLATSAASCSLVYPDDGFSTGHHDGAVTTDSGAGDATPPVDAKIEDTSTGRGDAGPVTPFCGVTTCNPDVDHCCVYVGGAMSCSSTVCPDPSTTSGALLSYDARCQTTSDCAGSGLSNPVCCVVEDWSSGGSIKTTECRANACPSWQLCDPGPVGGPGHDEECPTGQRCDAYGLYVRDTGYQQRFGVCVPIGT